jgi:hypothetical protein
VGPVGEPAYASPRSPGEGLVRRWDGRMVAGGPRHGAEASSSRAGPLPRARSASMRPPPPLRRRPGGAAAVGGALRSRRLAQPGVERGAADSWRPGVACLPGASAFASLLLSSLLRCFRVRLCGAMLTGFLPVVGRSWSSAPAIGMAPSTR